MPQRHLLPTMSAKRLRQQGRTYFVADNGMRYPSVTSVLNATKPQADRDALARWRSRVGYAEAGRISSQASRRGTQTHKQVKDFLLRDRAPDQAAISPYWQSVEPILQQIETVHLVESYVFHADLGYAGRVDCVARYQDTLCVLDWKTADRPKETVDRLRDSPLQLAAYCGAVNQTYVEQGIQLSHALVVVAVAHQPAELFWFDPDDVLDYWQQWTERLGKFQRYLM